MESPEIKEYTILAYTENNVGLLNRISIIFTRRKINIESFNASESRLKGVYSFSIVVTTTADRIKKVVGEIDKLVEVLKTFVYTSDQILRQEMALYKVSTEHLTTDHKLEKIVRENNARILNVDKEYIIIEKTGHKEETQKLLDLLEPYDVLEFMRTARIIMTKPMKKLTMYLEELERENGFQKPQLPEIDFKLFPN